MTENTEIKSLVRLVDTNVQGKSNIAQALIKIKGVGSSYAKMILRIADIDSKKKIGALSESEIKKLEDIIKNPLKYNIPVFALNRREDRETGEDKHILTTDIKFIQDFDIKTMKKMKSYKGIRHSRKLPVRGQRTKGHFRKGTSLGVKRKAGAKKGK